MLTCAGVVQRLRVSTVVDEKEKNEIKRLLLAYDRMLLVSGECMRSVCPLRRQLVLVASCSDYYQCVDGRHSAAWLLA